MHTTCAPTPQLVDMVLLHRRHGPGIVLSDTGDDLTIQLGLGSRQLPRGSQRMGHAQSAIASHLAELREEMTIRAPRDRVLDDDDWGIAPSRPDIQEALALIGDSAPSITLPTNNPPRCAETKDRALQELRSFTSAQRPRGWGCIAAVGHHVANSVDRQLGWWMLMGKESPVEYRERIADLVDRLGGSAWSDGILPDVPEDGSDSVIHCLSWLTELLSTSDRSSVAEASELVSGVVERRIQRRKPVIDGFIHQQSRRPRGR